jgi:glycosyltransferase involved in cell wall biosynthesis
VVALATTEAVVAVPPGAGVLATRVDDLVTALTGLVAEPERATAMGRCARAVALAEFGLDAFLGRWDRLLAEATR